jgi:hypothetical protein
VWGNPDTHVNLKTKGNYMVSRDQQHLAPVVRRFQAGKSIYNVIEEGYFRNTLEYPSPSKYSMYKTCECCGSRIKDEESLAKKREMMKKYNQEEGRLYNLFREALCVFHRLDIENSKVQKALSIAWDRGHANGYAEVASEFDDLLELLN